MTPEGLVADLAGHIGSIQVMGKISSRARTTRSVSGTR